LICRIRPVLSDTEEESDSTPESNCEPVQELDTNESFSLSAIVRGSNYVPVQRKLNEFLMPVQRKLVEDCIPVLSDTEEESDSTPESNCEPVRELDTNESFSLSAIVRGSYYVPVQRKLNEFLMPVQRKLVEDCMPVQGIVRMQK